MQEDVLLFSSFLILKASAPSSILEGEEVQYHVRLNGPPPIGVETSMSTVDGFTRWGCVVMRWTLPSLTLKKENNNNKMGNKCKRVVVVLLLLLIYLLFIFQDIWVSFRLQFQRLVPGKEHCSSGRWRWRHYGVSLRCGGFHGCLQSPPIVQRPGKLYPFSDGLGQRSVQLRRSRAATIIVHVIGESNETNHCGSIPAILAVTPHPLSIKFLSWIVVALCNKHFFNIFIIVKHILTLIDCVIRSWRYYPA